MFLATVLQWVRDAIPLVVNDFSARVGLGFGVSLLSIGSGIIIGLRISASMLIGGIVAWVLMPPWLVSQGLLAADGRRVDILLLVMWPSVGLLVAGGICALLLRWRVLMATFRSLAAADATTRRPPAALGRHRRRRCRRWLLIVVQSLFFATPVWHSVLAILLSVPLGLVALRVLGETNWGPISTMTNVMQAMFAVIAPGDLRASMVSSGITGAVAAESEGLMQDFRAGADDRLDAAHPHLHAAASRCRSARWRSRSCIRCCATPTASSARTRSSSARRRSAGWALPSS